MAIDPISAVILGIASIAGSVLGASISKPKMPKIPKIEMPENPDPIPIPNLALTPSTTAALQRARARNLPTSIGNSDIMLTSAKTRSQQATNISRTTLLGQ